MHARKYLQTISLKKMFSATKIFEKCLKENILIVVSCKSLNLTIEATIQIRVWLRLKSRSAKKIQAKQAKKLKSKKTKTILDFANK